MTLTVVLLVAFSIVLDVIGQLCFKLGLDRLPELEGGLHLLDQPAQQRGEQQRLVAELPGAIELPEVQVRHAHLGERGIRVNCVAPGPVKTKLAMAVHAPEIISAYYDAIPLNRYGETRELAEAIVFLCSDKAATNVNSHCSSNIATNFF